MSWRSFAAAEMILSAQDQLGKSIMGKDLCSLQYQGAGICLGFFQHSTLENVFMCKALPHVIPRGEISVRSWNKVDASLPGVFYKQKTNMLLSCLLGSWGRSPCSPSSWGCLPPSSQPRANSLQPMWHFSVSSKHCINVSRSPITCHCGFGSAAWTAWRLWAMCPGQLGAPRASCPAPGLPSLGRDRGSAVPRLAVHPPCEGKQKLNKGQHPWAQPYPGPGKAGAKGGCWCLTHAQVSEHCGVWPMHRYLSTVVSDVLWARVVRRSRSRPVRSYTATGWQPLPKAQWRLKITPGTPEIQSL